MSLWVTLRELVEGSKRLAILLEAILCQRSLVHDARRVRTLFRLIDVVPVGIYRDAILLVSEGVVATPNGLWWLGRRGDIRTACAQQAGQPQKPASDAAHARTVLGHQPNISFTLSKNPLVSG